MLYKLALEVSLACGGAWCLHGCMACMLGRVILYCQMRGVECCSELPTSAGEMHTIWRRFAVKCHSRCFRCNL